MNDETITDSPSRRDCLRSACSALAILGLTSGSVIVASCDSGGGGGEETLPPGVTRDGKILIVDLAEFPELQKDNNSLWIPAVDVIDIHGAAVGYRAFSSNCPNEGEDVEIFEPSEPVWWMDTMPRHSGRSCKMALK